MTKLCVLDNVEVKLSLPRQGSKDKRPHLVVNGNEKVTFVPAYGTRLREVKVK